MEVGRDVGEGEVGVAVFLGFSYFLNSFFEFFLLLFFFPLLFFLSLLFLLSSSFSPVDDDVRRSAVLAGAHRPRVVDRGPGDGDGGALCVDLFFCFF